MKYLSVFMLVFLFCNCSNTEEKIKPKPKKKILTSDFSDEPATMDIDYSNPVRVVEVLFEVAQTLNFEKLNNLCDPFGENNDASKAICELKDADKEKFSNHFKKGSIRGDVLIKNDTAWVPIFFGPEGHKEDVIVLIMRNEKWFIFDF